MRVLNLGRKNNRSITSDGRRTLSSGMNVCASCQEHGLRLGQLVVSRLRKSVHRHPSPKPDAANDGADTAVIHISRREHLFPRSVGAHAPRMERSCRSRTTERSWRAIHDCFRKTRQVIVRRDGGSAGCFISSTCLDRPTKCHFVGLPMESAGCRTGREQIRQGGYIHCA